MPLNSILRVFHFHPRTVAINCVGGFGGNCKEIGMKSIEYAQRINRAFLRDRRSREQRASTQTNPIRSGSRAPPRQLRSAREEKDFSCDGRCNVAADRGRVFDNLYSLDIGHICPFARHDQGNLPPRSHAYSNDQTKGRLISRAEVNEFASFAGFYK